MHVDCTGAAKAVSGVTPGYILPNPFLDQFDLLVQDGEILPWMSLQTENRKALRQWILTACSLVEFGDRISSRLSTRLRPCDTQATVTCFGPLGH